MSKVSLQLPESKEDEVNLHEYIDVIVKRKKLILIIFSSAVITAAIISFLMPKTYLSIATIQFGSVGEPLIKKSEAEESIKFYDFLYPIIKELKLETDVQKLKKAIKVEGVKDTDFFQLEVEYKDRDASFKLCKEISASFLAQANNLYKQRIDLAYRHLEELDRHMKSVQSDIVNTQKLISNLSTLQRLADTDAGIKLILLQNTLPNYQVNFMSLINQKNDLLIALFKAKEFKLAELVSNPKPIKPNKILNVTIFGIIGLMTGIFLAFFIESYEKEKEGKTG
jgi:uncharacterized protein involved in exopolysaccharide biosynthesis